MTAAPDAPISEVPALGLGREQSQTWVRLALTIATTLRHHRLTHGRAAFSHQHAALRRGAQYASDLDPRVAAMAAADETAFRHAAAAGSAATAGFEFLTSPDPQFGWTVHTTIGPIPATAPSGGPGRWGLWAHGQSGDNGGKELSVFVVVPDRDLAAALRDEVAHGQQRTLLQLRDLGVYGCLRADHARTQLRTTNTQFTEHVRHALHTAWPDHPDLTTAVLHNADPVGPDPDSAAPNLDAPDGGSLEGLHRRLRDFDERGYRPTDVLAAIDPDTLDRERPRAALAAALDTLAADGITAPQQQPRPPTSGHDRAAPPQHGTDLHAAAQLLRRHLDPDTTTAVTACRHWPSLARRLHTWHHDDTATNYLAAELARVPTQRVRDARAPAIYLRSVLDRSITFCKRHDTAAGDAADARQNTDAPTSTTPTATTESTATESRMDESTVDEQVPPTPFDIGQLDSTNALDREALRASRGAGTTADDDYIDTILSSDHPTAIQPPDLAAAEPTQEQHREPDPDQQEPENDSAPAAHPDDRAPASITTPLDRPAETDTPPPTPPFPVRGGRKRQNARTPRLHP
ncbi:hypothetical protein Ae168Ps1_6058 [Pseudonocardia sp. Ae168_Ps1]|uniref:hypothetical protein n=1 Tax=unclassified Pseudonocardia TaxID=2619320 RepID=UPI00094ACF70|nr:MULTISPECIES: hypothetical protein [unclassified Pseudonocardia]OLL70198.1 hypothetical protein Ae150APs1_6001 [Pseudonocardia sp. Ae150A_Ps1]OLL70593.1 hypothetical protein Ae168Ps1_6058 [Pseudonocardia sp. Ae168_Ps1]OLL70819.1 hypothetical protein Ae263Ps1_6233 [Pseudonocardia sp. Ae263_Ps1]OLL89378.1 hypothetical protein Ae356Ps1_6122 [Pseudonocardia sp. Ae356_Ps1]